MLVHMRKEKNPKNKKQKKGKPLFIKNPSKLVSELVGASSLWPRKLTKISLKTKKDVWYYYCDEILSNKKNSLKNWQIFFSNFATEMAIPLLNFRGWNCAIIHQTPPPTIIFIYLYIYKSFVNADMNLTCSHIRWEVYVAI